MQVFKKLRYFNAKCGFCGEIGLSIAGDVEGELGSLAVCGSCCNKLVNGISTAIAEMKRQGELKDRELEERMKKEVEDAQKGIQVGEFKETV